MAHLWEFDHPYYCNEGNYFKNELHEVLGSWGEFADQYNLLYAGDPDLNLLFRWDWKAWHLEYPEDEKEPNHVLYLFFMIQRKGFNISREIRVTEEDEPAVRAWLASRAEKMRELWAPLLGEATP